MTDQAAPEEAIPLSRWRPRWRLLAWGMLLVVLLVIAIGWTQRRQIATRFIDDELKRRGVAASYRVTAIGPRTQRLENVMIGDPARPDLTADWLEVETAIGLGGPEVRLIRGRGVRLYGRIEDGRLRLGEIDKLMPPPSGAPFTLPDVAVDLADTAMRLDTPAGRIGLSLAGRGNLADGFDGRVAAISSRLRFGACRVDRSIAVLRVDVSDRRPNLEGPVRAASLSCTDLALSRPQAAVDAILAEGLDRWRGEARLSVPQAMAGGASMLDAFGRLLFDGDANATKGSLDATTGSASYGDVRAGRTSLRGRYAFSPAGGGFSLRGDAEAASLVLGPATLRPVTSALAGAGGTPLGPIAEALATAVRRGGQGLVAQGAIAIASAGGGAVRIERLTAASRSGARMLLQGGDGLNYYMANGAVRLDGDLALSGGGFPETRLALDQPSPGAPITGQARIAEMRAGNSRLFLSPVRFGAAGGATRIETVALLSGPFSGGSVTNLLLPVSGALGKGGFAFGQHCTTARFQALHLSGLRLGATSLPLCPTGPALLYSRDGRIGGGATIASPRLAGTLGSSPLRVAAGRLRFDLGRADFTASDLAVRLGQEGSVHRLDAASLTGDFNNGSLAGRFSGTSAKLAQVPLLVSEGQGQWHLAGNRFSLDGSLKVAEEADPSRFHPLVSRDFRLTLADNQIDAGGWLTDPETGTRITQVGIDHALGTGRGMAVLDVPGIAFTPAYQPEELTRLTLGVIALVNGTVQGRGEIRWSPEGTTSTGTFSTAGMDLAAPFGPVEGLTTTVRFTDLLGLVSAPGQVATVDLVRTGIDVYDGTVSYQLLPDLKVRIESGRWPDAGGELVLEETILDFAQPSAKHITFRVVGLDAARFIQQMEFDNIAATGTFDGVVPMVFDERGGRIVGGHLEARAGGGTLSYIGELTDRDLGVYGKLAFDALKALSYDKFEMDLDGALDGEFVTRIELDGIARDVAAAPPAGGGLRAIFARRALSQIAKIPFEFNITIRGPFRTLLATARSLEDPTLLIQSALPPELQNQPISTVQPQESEPVQ